MAKKLAAVHCRACSGVIDRNVQYEDIDWVMTAKNWYFHKTCYEIWQKDKEDLHAAGSEDLWKDAVCQYLKKDLKIEVDWVKFSSQWTLFLKRKLTPKGIYFCLKYFYDIKAGDPGKALGGIGIVPNVYEEACQYWRKREYTDRGIVEGIEKQIIERQSQKTIIVNKIENKEKRKGETFNIALVMLLKWVI